VESFFSALLYNNPKFGFVVKSTDVPTKSALKLDTFYLNMVMPGIAGVYGPSASTPAKPVNVIFALKSAKNYRSWYDNENIYARATLNLKFNITMTDGSFEEGLDIDAVDMDTYFTTSVSGNAITMVIKKLVVRKIIVNHCKWGYVNTDFLIELLNVIFLP